jgi:hypothetical protein
MTHYCQVIGTSEKVLLHLVADTSTAEWIQAANPTSESLGGCYFGRSNRLEAYQEITERILAPEISTNLGFSDADKKTLAAPVC